MDINILAFGSSIRFFFLINKQYSDNTNSKKKHWMTLNATVAVNIKITGSEC